MPEPIIWKNETRKLSDLIPWPINPVQISQDEAKRLEESLDIFGQIQTIAISPSNEIYDGHQRQIVWGASQKFGKDYTVDVRVSSRELTEQERKKLAIYLRKGTTGQFDWDILANNFDVTDLLDWGFKPFELGIMGDGNNIEAEWQGMPEYGNVEMAFRSISVHFVSEEDLDNFAKLVDQNITERTKYIWYPQKERQDLKSLEFKSES